MAQHKRPPARPAKPSRPPRSSGGPRVSGAASVSVAPKFTLFGGSLFSFNFGGGRRGRRGGGLLKRVTGLASKAYREVTGKGGGGGGKSKGTTAGKGTAAGKRAGDPGSFDRFKDSRPDLFEGAGKGDEIPEVSPYPDRDDQAEVQNPDPRAHRPWTRPSYYGDEGAGGGAS